MELLKAETIIASLFVFVVAKLLGLKTRAKDKYVKSGVQKVYKDGDRGWMCGNLLNILIYPPHLLRFCFSESQVGIWNL